MPIVHDTITFARLY